MIIKILKVLRLYDFIWILHNAVHIHEDRAILTPPHYSQDMSIEEMYRYYFFAELIQYHNLSFIKINLKEYLVKGTMFSVFKLGCTYDEYFGNCIKSAERALIRKATKNGYYVKEISYDDYLSEIQVINTSKATRCAGEMSEDYIHVRARDIVTVHYNPDIYTFGCFSSDNKLVAYYMFEKITNFYHTVKGIGHAEHLSNGIMNYLLAYSISELSKKNQCDYIVYGPSGNNGLSNFKKHAGFASKYLIIKGKGRHFINMINNFNNRYILHGDTALNFITEYCN